MKSENKATKREQILNHAISQFNAQGYYDTRLEDIARASGTGATNISYHFKSKEALLEEAYGLTTLQLLTNQNLLKYPRVLINTSKASKPSFRKALRMALLKSHQ